MTLSIFEITFASNYIGSAIKINITIHDYNR